MYSNQLAADFAKASKTFAAFDVRPNEHDAASECCAAPNDGERC